MSRKPNLTSLGSEVPPGVRRNFDELRTYFETLGASEYANTHATIIGNPHQTTHGQLLGVYASDATSTDTSATKHLSDAQAKSWTEHVAVVNANPHGTDHSMLDSVGVLDVASTNTTQDKHLSNANGKKWEDHVDASSGVHGVTGAVVGTTDTQTLTNKKFGGATDYAEFEADGTLELHGAATGWKDSMIPANSFRTGGTALTLAQFIGNIWMLRLDVGDILYVQVQLQHDTKENTIIYPHLHFAVNSAIGATGYNVEVTTEHSWANFNTVFPVATVTSTGLVYSFQNAAQYTHGILSLASITPVAGQGGISSYVIFKIERITASVEPLNPATSLFILGMDIHYEIDTPAGSRTISGK